MTGRVAAILLAAGKSRRMGSCKQLLPLGRSTVIECYLETLFAAGVNEIVVVVSPEGDTVAEAVRRYPAAIAVNPLMDGDMASSVRIGREALSPEASGVIIALCDYTLVLPDTVTSLVAGHAGAPGSIFIPCHEGRRGHPLLFPRAALNELAEGLILRDLVRRDPDRVVQLDVADDGILVDMDTPEDYRRVREMALQR